MKTFASLSFAAFLVAAGAAPALAQDQAPAPAPAPAQEQEAQVQSIEGDLVKIDSDAKMITVKSAEGSEVQLSYTDDTVVSGQEGTQGLATLEGSKVKVFFTTSNEARTATRIEVQKAEKK